MEKVQKEKMQMREKVGKSLFTMFFRKQRCGAIWPDERRKSARRCGAKRISKSKFTKHTSFGPLLEVAMSKKCTPLWGEAHFQVKSVKNWGVRTTF